MASDIASQNNNLLVNGAKSSVLVQSEAQVLHGSMRVPSLSLSLCTFPKAPMPSLSCMSAGDVATLLEDL
jgi:hypothetical protein